MNKSSVVLSILSLVAVTVIVYINSLKNGFVYDDTAYVVTNHHIRSFKYISSYLTDLQAFQGTGVEGHFKVYRPLVTFSFAIDYALWKLNSAGYHITNLILHCIAGILVFFCFLSFSRKRTIAFFTALIFLIHPVQTESVVWISGRGNMLYSIFALLCLLKFLKYIEANKILDLLSTILWYIMALLSKEMALCIIPLLSLVYFYQAKQYRNSLKKFLWLILALVCISFIYILIRYLVVGTVSQKGYWGGSPEITFFTMLSVIPLYLKRLVFPVGLNVLPVIHIITSIREPACWISAIVVCIITFISLIPKFIKTNYIFGVWWVFLSLLPVLNIIPLRALFAERFLYLGVAGFAFYLSSILIPRKKFNLLWMLFVVNLFSILTIVRNTDWKSNNTLWHSVVRLEPNNAKAYNGLGVEALKRNDTKTAQKYFQQALGYMPNNIDALINLAITYKKEGDDDKCEHILKNIMESSGQNNAIIFHNLGLFLLEGGKYMEAKEYLLKSVEIDPHYANAFNSLGLCYAYLNNETNAVDSWLRASQLKGGWIEPLYNIIVLYLKEKKYSEAHRFTGFALSVFPNEKIFIELQKKLK